MAKQDVFASDARNNLLLFSMTWPTDRSAVRTLPQLNKLLDPLPTFSCQTTIYHGIGVCYVVYCQQTYILQSMLHETISKNASGRYKICTTAVICPTNHILTSHSPAFPLFPLGQADISSGADGRALTTGLQLQATIKHSKVDNMSNYINFSA